MANRYSLSEPAAASWAMSADFSIALTNTVFAAVGQFHGKTDLKLLVLLSEDSQEVAAGKADAAVINAIINKKTMLSDEEYSAIQRHPMMGRRSRGKLISVPM